MNLFGLMQTSGSAMQAERMRAEVVAANMANAETTRTETGGPYRRQQVVFAANAADPALTASPFASTMTAAGAPALLPLPPLPGAEGPANGVRIDAVVEDPTPPLKRYDPGHPDAGPDGYVSYPELNPLTEMVDLMGATRAYGLNSSAVQAEKVMITASLDIART